jgi:UDP-N-acetylmuramyl pentapeptide phosphotransferase/UDP-N-acetylglucosamine-1-phosphate transferase
MQSVLIAIANWIGLFKEIIVTISVNYKKKKKKQKKKHTHTHTQLMHPVGKNKFY